jgi:glyoxylase-like metal-dependent hydrolase (beta-lactamase superfamily II)/predicted ester cyclase
MSATQEKPTRTPSRRGAKAETAKVAKRYFDAVAAKDLDEMVACWKTGAVDRIVGQGDLVAPGGVRAWFDELFCAIPDWRFEVLDMVVEGDRAVVRWHATGTFTGPGWFQGFAPTGGRIDLEGSDMVTVEDGLLTANHAYTDGMTIARHLGVMPPAESPAEQGMQKLVNARTKIAAKIADPPEEIADGVWIVRGGFPRKGFNVYFVRDGDGVLMFDAAIRAMTNSLAAAGAQLGGITRVLLGHGHADHRGAAAGLRGIPVLCHVDEVADAEGDGGAHYMDVSKVKGPARWLYPSLLKSWDGGPVQISGTVEEGDQLAGFKVIHIPGHAPGLIALWRESDRIALVSDGFYTADPEKFKPGPPRVAHAAFNWDTEKARESVRKLANLEPNSAWPGHADPLTGDVKGQLLRAADTT